jgi:hypothetical protein
MAWSYNDGLFNAKDLVRFLIQDTDSTDKQLQDGEILWLLSQYNNTPMNAAIRACEVLVAKYTRMCDESVGQVKIMFSQKAKAYIQLQNLLVNRLAREDAAPYAGGISVSDKQVQDQNTDRVRPDFTKHMMENHQFAPWTTQPQYWMWLNFEEF